LNHQIDYLLDYLDQIYESGVVKPTDWKLLTVFIGSNDICHSCTEVTSLPPAFSVNVLAAIERIRTSVPNVLVQIGQFYK
jgi:phospholipase B1